MDSKLIVKNLEVFANHGVFEEEKKLGQKFVVSLEVWFEIGAGAQRDKLESTINYAELCGRVGDFLTSRSYDLIEAAAAELCEQMLMEYPLAKRLKVCLKKPWAPIHMHLDWVAVEVECARQLAYIGLGSNLGEREQNLRDALALIDEHPFCRVLQVSEFCETDPVGYEDQGRFVNAVAEIETICAPGELMELLLETENSLGRERSIRWGPRTIDLDILLYGDLILPGPLVTLPHPRMAERMFVMEPLCQLAPFAVHPILRKTVQQIRDELAAAQGGKA